jgi:hypothetical protein
MLLHAMASASERIGVSPKERRVWQAGEAAPESVTLLDAPKNRPSGPVREVRAALMAQSQPSVERVPAIVAAGDGKAAKAIHGESKVYLEVAGEPMVARVVAALQQVPEVSEVWVVGNDERLAATLSADSLQRRLTKPLAIVPQYRNLLENAWQTYRRMLPGAGVEGRDPVNDEEADLRILYLSADLPLLVPQEISAFIRAATEADCDYGLGLSTEASMTPFYPRAGQPGIQMAYFNTAEDRLRQNNLHLVRPARLGRRQAVEDMYEHRYQKELGQVIGLAWRILTNQGGGPSIVFYYGFMQLALLCDRAKLRGLADVIRRAVPLARIERACSSLLDARFRLIVTGMGGCAIDIDNEKDLEVTRTQFEAWQRELEVQAERLYGPPPLPAKVGEVVLQVLAPGPLAGTVSPSVEDER